MSSGPALPRICYVLTTEGEDIYALMTRISAASVRRLHPDAEIVLLCDPESESALRGAASPLLNLCDTVVSVAPDIEGRMQRSRWLKSSLRNVIDGELLYVDADTVAVKPLAVEPAPGEHVLAALDGWDLDGTPIQGVHDWVWVLADRLGWTIPGFYRNSGVIYFRDSAAARSLGQRWHEEWQRSAEVGCYRDQPAFNAVLGEFGDAVGTLPTTMNAMVRYRAWMARRARLYHFWAEGNPVADEPDTLLDHLIAHMRATGMVDYDAISRSGRLQYPWARRQGVPIALVAGAYRVAFYELVRKVVRSALSFRRRYD
ncbi:MAG: hypothetical protein H0U85_04845 [Gemmatimonadales bacterium]|nr:hypothetical protein [Gemmatimonadales bacterium]